MPYSPIGVPHGATRVPPGDARFATDRSGYLVVGGVGRDRAPVRSLPLRRFARRPVPPVRLVGRSRQEVQRPAFVVQLDRADHVGDGDQVHTPRNGQFGGDGDGFNAQVFRPVLLVPVAQWPAPRLPASAVIAAPQGAVGFQEPVVAVLLPLGRLTPAGDPYAGAGLVL